LGFNRDRHILGAKEVWMSKKSAKVIVKAATTSIQSVKIKPVAKQAKARVSVKAR
jgi:hypothetical protein